MRRERLLLPHIRRKVARHSSYADGKLDIEAIRKHFDGRIIEVARVCMQRDHRGPEVVATLLAATEHHASNRQAKALIGYTSVFGMEHRAAWALSQRLKGYLAHGARVVGGAPWDSAFCSHDFPLLLEPWA